METNSNSSSMTDPRKLMNDLQQKGYTDEYKIQDGHLFCLTNEKTYEASDVVAINFYRNEGPSNPDDMSILYAIETQDGRKGTLLDAYGAYADAQIGEFMQLVETHKSVHKEKMY